MESLLVDDSCFALDHTPTRRRMRRKIIAATANRTVERNGANHRVSAMPAMATAAAPRPADHPKGRKYQAATRGIAAPTVNAAAGPTRSIARGSQEVPIAAPTFIPDRSP